MAWQTPVIDHTELSRFTHNDMNRIADNINYLQHALNAPEELVIAFDDAVSSKTYQHLLSQIPAGAKITFEMADGYLKAVPISGYTISTIELTETTAERDTYTVTFTNSETEVFYVQNSLGLVVMVIKADYTENDILTLAQWQEVISSTIQLCNKYGIKYTQAPTTVMMADNINNVENLLLLCYERLLLWQKQASQNIYVQNQYGRYVNQPVNNYVRGYNY